MINLPHPKSKSTTMTKNGKNRKKQNGKTMMNGIMEDQQKDDWHQANPPQWPNPHDRPTGRRWRGTIQLKHGSPAPRASSSSGHTPRAKPIGTQPAAPTIPRPRQALKIEAPQAPRGPAVSSKPSHAASTVMEDLRNLREMRRDGDIDDEEFEKLKAAIMKTFWFIICQYQKR